MSKEETLVALKDDDIVTTPVKPRRRFLAKIGAAVAGALAIVTATVIQAQRDAKDFIPADSKLKDMDKKNTINNDKRQGDQS